MHNDNRRSSTLQQTSSEKEALSKNGFLLTDKLGQGGYGKVYLAEYISIKHKLKLKLACKIIDTNKKDKTLPQELKIITKLNHPHIIQIHSIFQRKQKFFIFMRYAENGDILEYILKDGPVEESLAKLWTRQICLAIQYLHILEIAHRDLKCENILLTISNSVKLADFGFSRSVVDSHNKAILCETYCGSISYASPQILRGEPYYAKATDMWSLGCVIYVMLNKAFPFDSKNLRMMIKDQMFKNYKFRSKYSSNYGNEIKSLVYGLLEPNQSLRLTIDNVITSDWITMDTSLRVLNKRESAALGQARAIASNNKEEHMKANSKNNNVKVPKSKNIQNDGFDLSTINSSINTHRRMST